MRLMLRTLNLVVTRTTCVFSNKSIVLINLVNVPHIKSWSAVGAYIVLRQKLNPDTVGMIINMVIRSLREDVHIEYLTAYRGLLQTWMPLVGGYRPAYVGLCMTATHGKLMRFVYYGDPRGLFHAHLCIPHFLRAYVQSGLYHKGDSYSFCDRFIIPTFAFKYFTHNNNSPDLRNPHCVGGGQMTRVFLDGAFVETYTTLCPNHTAFTPHQSIIDRMFLLDTIN